MPETFAYELSLTSVNHSNNYKPEHKAVGVWSSKTGAVSAAGSIDTEYGTFDSAIDSMFEYNHVDNRENPPDNGCLLQIGSKDTGEGDYVQLKIKKVVIESYNSAHAELAAERASSVRDKATRDAFVYVLSLTSVSHSLNYKPEHQNIGVYSTKTAAAFAAGTVRTAYGTFDDAIEEMFEEHHVDNRNNPPDNGCLLQIGSEEFGEGDYEVLNIEKFALEEGNEGNTPGRSRRGIHQATHQQQEQASLLNQGYNQGQQLIAMQSLLRHQPSQPSQRQTHQSLLQSFGQQTTTPSQLGMLQNANMLSPSPVAGLGTDLQYLQSLLLGSVTGPPAQNIDLLAIEKQKILDGAGGMQNPQIQRALLQEQTPLQERLQAAILRNHLGTMRPQEHTPQLTTNRATPSVNQLATVASAASNQGSSSAKNKKSKVDIDIPAPNVSKKRKLETKESSRATDAYGWW